MKSPLSFLALGCLVWLLNGFTQIQAQSIQRISANCSPATSRTTIEINQIRATYGAAATWWFQQGANDGFEVPKGSDKRSLFAGSLWVGGIANNQLKVAAQTYRQAPILGVGYWPGPLDVSNAQTVGTTCVDFDRLWKVSAAQIRDHIALYNTPGYQMPTDIATWPASGPVGYDPDLAPYVDVNNNGTYDPQNGDYPAIYGDEALWSVYNDNGNINGHGGSPLGIEIQEMIFGFDQSGPLSNALIHHYKIINRGNVRLDSTMVGLFVDPDLGNGIDDFVGCDVSRSMGYVYNGDADDDGPAGYGATPPALGVVMFDGIYSDFNDGLDNNLNGNIDELVPDCSGTPRTERYKMWNFTSFVNDATPVGNPTSGIHAYNFLQGRWKDNTPISFGGNGYGSMNPTNRTRYMYPGASDPAGYGLGGTIQNPISSPFNWSEYNTNGMNASNSPGDRRFVMSSGPTTMLPGAVNYMTIGLVWSRASSGDQFASVQTLNTAVDQIQALFDNCSFYTLNALSIFERGATSRLRIYPNPAQDVVYLKGDMADATKAVISIYSLNGQLIAKTTQSTANQREIAVDIQSLRAGMYLVKAEAGSQILIGKLLVR